ncbi:MAG: hypothetical protein WBM17_01275 [Anaerolineales bacterium]
MTDFIQLRDILAAKRRELEQKRKDALLAGEAAKQAEDALSQFARSEKAGAQDQRRRLEAEGRAAQAQALQAGDQVASLRADVERLHSEFETFTDPRRELGRWPADVPVLLFPLRLETRFKTDGGGTPQLWVRVFPDSCLIDSFEETLTGHEIADGRIFWSAIWRADGNETLERAAWRNLVAAYGSGRASWIVRTYLPLNPSEKPSKSDPTDILLIIPAPGPLPAEAATYWEKVWRAGGDATEIQAAYADLELALGADPAREIADHSRPVNLGDAPTGGKTYITTRVAVAVLQLAPAESLPTRRSSWSSAPRTALLPDRFVLVGFRNQVQTLLGIGRTVSTPLIAGPDPNAPPDQQLRPQDDTLQIPDDLAWMFDFERAISVGMALRINLTPEQARDGFDRVVVLGVRLGDSAAEGLAHVEELLEHHLRSRTGLEILPQGTPTNNTEKEGAGYSFREDPDASFDRFFRRSPSYTRTPDPLQRADGQWLADLLGLRDELVQQIPHAGGFDQREARAMQIALWPGTVGYMMKTLLAPVFSPRDIADTRLFFTRQISGRGPLPVLRIGRQPYGILPTTAFGRIKWFQGSPEAEFAGKLHGILMKAEADWTAFVERVNYIGKEGGDPHQVLLDVLGLHPGSVEYYPLQAESIDHKFLEMALIDYPSAQALVAEFPPVVPLMLLRSYGYTGDAIPDLLNKIYKARQTPLDGPLVDDRPLSETDPVRNYAGARNYIEWLHDAATVGIERIQREEGFDGGQAPSALLYLLLRNALQLGFHAVGAQLLADAGLVENAQSLSIEPAFVHISGQKGASESRYMPLYRTAEKITGSPAMILGDYIAKNLPALDPDLQEQIEAMRMLSRLPTARLERLFAEHIDTVSYRLDAWKTGLLAWRLGNRPQGIARPAAGSTAGAVTRGGPTGLFLGAYGWLEPLRPGGKVLTPAGLPQDLGDVINKHESVPLLRDSTSGGLIHAPSLNHATTAAVLRNGYIANEGRLAVNLTSRRVRLALGILEGMRAGQSLGALLGYQFERFVHDHGPLQVHDLIYHLRRAFPLAANQITATQIHDEEARESIAAMNVVDGRKLVEQVESSGRTSYPFGVSALPGRPADQETAITNAVAFLRDINDAVADLVLAEGVHQAVLGNYDRSAGTLDAFSKGAYPPEPDVIRTPRTGTALTLRTAIHLSPNPVANPFPSILLSPLAKAEPALNAWLTGRLPAPTVVGCNVTFTSRLTNSVETSFVSQEHLGLQPIDLVFMAGKGEEQSWSDLDDRIIKWIHETATPRMDKEIRILHTDRIAGKITWFELRALLGSLHVLIASARPLQPADLMRQNDAAREEQAAITLPRAVIQSPRDDLFTFKLPGLDALKTALQNPATTIDAGIAQFAGVFGTLAAYRLPQTGTGFAFEWRARLYSRLVAKVTDRIRIWDDHLTRFDAILLDYDAHVPAIPEQDRISILQSAEILVRSNVTKPAPVSSAGYRLDLDAARIAFLAKRNQLAQIEAAGRPTLNQLFADIQDQLTAGSRPALASFDPSPFDLADEEQELIRFRAKLVDAVSIVKEDLIKRIGKVDALLAEHDTADAIGKVKKLQEAGKLLFGDDFSLVPQIALPASAADECANAWKHSTTGALTRFLTDTAGRDFPVDDWLHGVARVREKMHHWENVVLLGEAFGADDPGDLIPLQLPFDASEPWLALEMPDGTKINSDRLLYTAHFAEPFDASKPVCGLLMDEWTEVIPNAEETTGIAFHYDRPNAEPPQAWLLAMSPAQGGTWMWEDLLAAVQDTLDSAKRRAVEPVHLDASAYSTFLPASVSAYTFPEISISNNLLQNKKIYKRMARE